MIFFLTSCMIELTCPSFSSFLRFGSLSRSGVLLRNFSTGETDRLNRSSGIGMGLRSSGVSAAVLCCWRSDGLSRACAWAAAAAATLGCGGGARCGGTPAAAAAAPANPRGNCWAWICCWINTSKTSSLNFPPFFSHHKRIYWRELMILRDKDDINLFIYIIGTSVFSSIVSSFDNITKGYFHIWSLLLLPVLYQVAGLAEDAEDSKLYSRSCNSTLITSRGIYNYETMKSITL